jgi:hypothetical protein
MPQRGEADPSGALENRNKTGHPKAWCGAFWTGAVASVESKIRQDSLMHPRSRRVPVLRSSFAGIRTLDRRARHVNGRAADDCQKRRT